MKAITLRRRKELSHPIIIMKNNDEKEVVEEEQRGEVHKPKEDEVIPRRINFLDNPSSYVPPLPYPQRLVKAKLDKQF